MFESPVTPFVESPQPIIDRYYEIAPGDIPDPTFKDLDGQPHVCERAPLYRTASLVDPAAAVWVDKNYTGGGSDGTQARPYLTLAAGVNAIAAGASNKWLVIKSGVYRETFGGGSFSKVIGITGARNAYVWIDGSAQITTGTWTLSGGAWTWSGVYNPQFTPPGGGDPPADQIFINGVPLVRKASGTPGPGQFAVAGTTLRVGTNPVGQLVEYADLDHPGRNYGTKNGFTIQYVGFRRWTRSAIILSGADQVLSHVVIAYGAGDDTYGHMLVTSGTDDLTMSEVVLTHGSGKSWQSHRAKSRRSVGVRIDSNNWRRDYDTRPSATASLGGAKISADSNSWDDQLLVRKCQSNGYWLDVRCGPYNTITRASFLDNAGYGFTHEVGTKTRICDFLSLRNGYDSYSRDGFRLSGVNDSEVYNGTCANNGGADIAFYEDSRQYAGPGAGSRALDGLPGTSGNPVDLGNQVRTKLLGCVALRGPNAAAGKGAFYSISGAIIPLDNKPAPSGDGWGDPGNNTGWCQTRPLHTKEMFADDFNDPPLTYPAFGKNVYIKTKNEAGKFVRWATPTPGAQYVVAFGGTPPGEKFSSTAGCTTTTLVDLTDIHAIDANLELGSVMVDDPGAAISKYFPGSTASPQVWTWKALTNIPGTATAIPTHTLPTWTVPKVSGGSDTIVLAVDILGLPTSGTAAKAGCYFAPTPTVPGGAPAVLTIDTAMVDDATVGVSYSFTLAKTGGVGPYTWAKDVLPAGLSLNTSTGAITGTPTTAGLTTTTFTLTDSTPGIPLTDTATVVFTVVAADPPTIIPTVLPNATAGVAYSFTLTASGGTGPYTWSRIAGTFPSGYTIAPLAGTIAGTNGTPQVKTFTIQCADSTPGVPQTTSRQFTLTVAAAGTTPDVATLSAPTAGTVSGLVAVTAHGHDPQDGDTVQVELLVDGVPAVPRLLLARTTGDTYTGTWDSTAYPDDGYDLTIKVTDTGGLFLLSAPTTVTVANGMGDTTPPTVTGLSLSDGTTLSTPLTVSVTVTDASGVSAVIGRITFPDGHTSDIPMT